MLLVLLESPGWVGFKEGDLEAFRPKDDARDIGFWVIFVIENSIKLHKKYCWRKNQLDYK
jgi:hypothetical protein